MCKGDWYAAVLLAIVAGAATYLACVEWRVPIYWYELVDRRWHFGFQRGLAMGWYGRTLWVALGAVAGGFVGRHIPGRPGVFAALAIAALVLTVGTALVIVAINLHRPGTPLPIL